MVNIKVNAAVIQLPDNTPPHAAIPDPDEIHPAMVEWGKFMLLVYKHANVTFGYLLPSEGQIAATDSDTDTDTNVALAGLDRGVMRALVVVPPPLVTHLPPQTVPDECRLRLVLLICACSSPAAIIGLSRLIGSIVLSADVPVDPSEVLDIVNESTGHVSGNVAVANSFNPLEVALKLVGLA